MLATHSLEAVDWTPGPFWSFETHRFCMGLVDFRWSLGRNRPFRERFALFADLSWQASGSQCSRAWLRSGREMLGAQIWLGFRSETLLRTRALSLWGVGVPERNGRRRFNMVKCALFAKGNHGKHHEVHKKSSQFAVNRCSTPVQERLWQTGSEAALLGKHAFETLASQLEQELRSETAPSTWQPSQLAHGPYIQPPGGGGHFVGPRIVSNQSSRRLKASPRHGERALARSSSDSLQPLVVPAQPLPASIPKPCVVRPPPVQRTSNAGGTGGFGWNGWPDGSRCKGLGLKSSIGNRVEATASLPVAYHYLAKLLLIKPL